MPSRTKIIETIGSEYQVENIEAGEFSYPKEFKRLGKNFKKYKIGKFEKLDIRFVKSDVSVLVETKQDIYCDLKKAKEQLAAYVSYERTLLGDDRKIIAILASTQKSGVIVYRDDVDGTHEVKNIKKVVPMDDYCDVFNETINNKEMVMMNTSELNKILHKHSVKEVYRSQFVGTCLLCLKEGLKYEGLLPQQIIGGISAILDKLLTARDSQRKKEKIKRLSDLFYRIQCIRVLDYDAWFEILYFIEDKILPFINDKNFAGQDLLNLFFITFNKYVGKADKNQAFTPDHITDFMSKVTGVNRDSRVLDYCCGSGSFLVKAMSKALKDVEDDGYLTKKQKQTIIERIKKDQIFGIEYEDKAFGLAVTNMLIHSDGNSNIMQGNCFEQKKWIQNIAKPNVILLNPPYNCQRASHDKKYVHTWTKDEDPSKGLYFVKWISDVLFEVGLKAKMAVLLPVSCAISDDKEIASLREDILQHNTLDAVFSLPNEVFYPGASASACCMVFNMGVPHNTVGNPDTFFGYYKDDGFKKKKGLGRVEQIEHDGTSKWEKIEEEWLKLYRNRTVKAGLSSVQHVTAKEVIADENGDDQEIYPEWICEAYMETDFNKICDDNYRCVLNDYISAHVKEGDFLALNRPLVVNYNVDYVHKEKKFFKIGKLFGEGICKGGKYNKDDLTETEIFSANKVHYITRTGDNNGCEWYVMNDNFKKLEGPNAITIGDTTATCFYQDKEFICGDHMIVLRSDWLNKYIGLFVVALLQQEQYRYNYGRAFVVDLVKETKIPLPIIHNDDGTPFIDVTHKYSDDGYLPDWKWMENYVKSLPYGDRI